jgi:hypothetical protein
MPEDSERTRVAAACRAELDARGDPGRAALAWLTAPPREPETPLERALEEALALPPRARGAAPAAARALVDLGDPPRAIVLGDLHGRLDAALPALREAGALAADGRFAAPPGTALVQMGDVIDADLGEDFPPRLDPRADRLVARFGAQVRDALAAARLAERDRADLLAALDPPGPSRDDVACARARHALVGASLAWLAVRGLMRLEAEAAAAGARAVALLGNHEVDLLSGRLLWFAAQKRLLLRFGGFAEPDEVIARLRAAPGPDEAREILAPAPELAWIAALPLAARAGPLLLLHGGPTRAATDEIEARGVDSAESLARWLTEQARAPFGGPFFAEGASILSPGRAADDFVAEEALLTPWLAAARADFLVVGHSPFLGIAAGRWLDLDAPEVRERTRRVARLGAHGNVLKVDTDLKRGSRAEALRLDREAGRLDAVAADGGARSLLEPGEPLAAPRGGGRTLELARRVLRAVDAHRPPLLRDLAEPGLDSVEHERALAAVERLARARGEEEAAAARRDLAFLLYAGPADLRRATRWLLAWEAGEPEARAALAGHRRAVEARVDALAAAAAAADGPALRLLLDPRAREVEGASYRLLEAVLERARRARRARGLAPLPALAAELVRSAGEPAVTLAGFDAEGRRVSDEVVPLPPGAPRTWEALERFAGEALRAADVPRAAATELPPPAAPVATRPASPVAAASGGPALPLAALERLLAENARALGARVAVADCAGLSLVEEGKALRPGFFEVRGPWLRLRGLLSAEPLLLLADTVFVDPAESFTALRLGPDGAVREALPHARALLPLLGDCDPVRLWSQLKPAVVACLERGELERIGAGAGARGPAAPWQRGCYLFATPSAAAARTFAAHNPVAVSFEVPRAVLEGWLGLGLARLDIMVADFDATLDAEGRLGVPEAALEVVAIGTEGAAALWGWRAR